MTGALLAETGPALSGRTAVRVGTKKFPRQTYQSLTGACMEGYCGIAILSQYFVFLIALSDLFYLFW